MRSLRQIAVSRWYAVLSGVLLTTIAGSLVFACVPLYYRSSGTLVVMPPKRSASQSTNPLLELDSRMHATASVLTQTIGSPLLSFRAGLVPGTDTVTAKNAAISSATSENGSPLITITAESRDALRSPAIVSWVTDLSRENLAQTQRELKVGKKNTLTLEAVVAPTPSKPLVVAPVGATTATVLLGLVLTALAAYRVDRADVSRRRHGLAPVVPFEDAGHPLTVVPAHPDTREDREAG